MWLKISLTAIKTCMYNYVGEIFNNIKNRKVDSFKDLFICDILNIISFGYYVNIIKINKNIFDEDLMLMNLKKEGKVLSFFRLDTPDYYYYMFVSKDKINMETNCNFLDFLNLFDTILYADIIYYYSETVFFENILYNTEDNFFFSFPNNWKYFSSWWDDDFYNIYFSYNDGNLDFTGEIENLKGKCYSLNKKTLNNFIIYFVNNVENENFYAKNKFILDKYDIHYDETETFAVYEFIGPVYENHFYTIIRLVTPEKLIITWSNKSDLHIVLNLLYCSYTENVDFFCNYKIIINNEIYTNVNEKMVKVIFINNIKKIEILFIGDKKRKELLYNNELWDFHLVFMEKNPQKATDLNNLELHRINKLNFIDVF